MKKLFVLLSIIAVLCTGCFYRCENCEELEYELSRAEDRISELYMQLEDAELEAYGNIEEIANYLLWAEEYLSGQFLDVEPDEALRIIREAQDYIGDYMY